MQHLYLGIFVAVVFALVVCGCILDAETKKKATNELRPRPAYIRPERGPLRGQ